MNYTANQSPSPENQTPPPEALATAQNEYGSMSLNTPDKRLAPYATTPGAVEITDVILENTPQALMGGQKLPSQLEDLARKQGFTELLVTSGPNANPTAIEFWNRVFGKPVATEDDYYGPNYAALIWRKQINDD